MFLRILLKSFVKNKQRKLLAVLMIALGISVVSALANIWIDIENKVGNELRVYGSNIVLKPKFQALPFDSSDLNYNPLEKTAFLDEADLKNLKTIFWQNNIVAFAPYIQDKATVKGKNGKRHSITIAGTWFDKKLKIETGQDFRTGIKKIKTWWSVNGRWPDDNYDNRIFTQALVGKALANQLNLKKDNKFFADLGNGGFLKLQVTGILSGDVEEENKVFVSLAAIQRLQNLKNKFEWVEISALTTPDNQLAIKYDNNPESLSSKEYEVWYCTAFVKSIALQAQEVIKGSEAKPLRQISDSEGTTLNKIKTLMVIFMIFASLISIIGIWNLMSGYVVIRSNEVGLSKAIGAGNLSIIKLFLSEALLLGLAGGILGVSAGLFFSSIIGYRIFNDVIKANINAVLISIAVSVLIALVGNMSAIWAITRLKIKEALYNG